MQYEIDFASESAEETMRSILQSSDMDIAGEVEDHVLIKCGGEIRGVGMMVQTDHDEFHLVVFGVRQQERKSGIGSRLLQELLSNPWQYCRDAVGTFAEGFRVTTVSKGPSAGFYAKQGFRSCDFKDIAEPYRGQCTECPDIAACGPVPMLFERRGTDGLN